MHRFNAVSRREHDAIQNRLRQRDMRHAGHDLSSEQVKHPDTPINWVAQGKPAILQIQASDKAVPQVSHCMREDRAAGQDLCKRARELLKHSEQLGKPRGHRLPDWPPPPGSVGKAITAPWPGRPSHHPNTSKAACSHAPAAGARACKKARSAPPSTCRPRGV